MLAQRTARSTCLGHGSLFPRPQSGGRVRPVLRDHQQPGHLSGTARGARASRSGSVTSSTSICASPGTTRSSIATCSTSPAMRASTSRPVRASRCCRRSARRSRWTIVTARSILIAVHHPLRHGFAGRRRRCQVRSTKLDGTYYIPLDRYTGNSDWGIAVSGGVGYFFNLGVQEKIIDRFFLGGDNLRGFQAGGAGPHNPFGGDSLGGRFIWTQSTELRSRCRSGRYRAVRPRFRGRRLATQASFESGRCPGVSGGAAASNTVRPFTTRPRPRVGAAWAFRGARPSA